MEERLKEGLRRIAGSWDPYLDGRRWAAVTRLRLGDLGPIPRSTKIISTVFFRCLFPIQIPIWLTEPDPTLSDNEIHMKPAYADGTGQLCFDYDEYERPLRRFLRTLHICSLLQEQYSAREGNGYHARQDKIPRPYILWSVDFVRE